MQERTAFRLAMLANGFQPLLNDCKRPIEKGWPKRTVDEAEVLSWDRSALASTGLRIDGDLAVIDVDVSEAGLVEALAATRDLTGRVGVHRIAVLEEHHGFAAAWHSPTINRALV